MESITYPNHFREVDVKIAPDHVANRVPKPEKARFFSIRPETRISPLSSGPFHGSPNICANFASADAKSPRLRRPTAHQVP
jgi:hypothetical protein